jgi:hypothetical protein
MMRIHNGGHGENANMEPWTPGLSVRELSFGCRLTLTGIAYGDGATLQQAADQLVTRVVAAASAVNEVSFAPGLPPPDARVLGFLYAVWERAARREEVRGLILGA